MRGLVLVMGVGQREGDKFGKSLVEPSRRDKKGLYCLVTFLVYVEEPHTHTTVVRTVGLVFKTTLK